MARGKDQVEWRRAREGVELIRAALVSDPWLPPGLMDPYYVPRESTLEQRNARMEGVLLALDKTYGAR